MRALAAGLPRSYEVIVRGRVKFRVGEIVYLAFSKDEKELGFAFPKEEREAALATYPEKFIRPSPSDMQFQWLEVRLDTLDRDELRELVFDAWRRGAGLCSDVQELLHVVSTLGAAALRGGVR